MYAMQRKWQMAAPTHAEGIIKLVYKQDVGWLKISKVSKAL